MNRWQVPILCVAWIALSCCYPSAGEPPRVLELRIQKIEAITYFHVRLEQPADLRLPVFDTSKPFSESDRRKFARLPRLVPQDEKTRCVCYRQRSSQPWLSFCGQASGGGKAKLLLLYPRAEQALAKDAPLAELMRTPSMAEADVELDFDKARVVAVPKMDPQDQHILLDDLRSYWAVHQAAHFAVLETQVVDFNFYSFAREATGRKYNVVAPAWVRRQTEDAEHRLYEITTGADALAETLQLHRLLQPEARPQGEHSVPIAGIEGPTVPQQPWERMLENKKPAIEPHARLVPHDNYYVYFKNIRKFIEAGELFDQWGTNVLRVYEMKGRDAQLRPRYERQLCLKSTALGKLLGPAVVKGIALTGNDPYVREGTDITVLFDVANRALFRAAVEGFLEEARKEHGGRLREGREEYHSTKIESFVTPLREVSLHRATLGDVVIYSNSPTAVRRVIDAQQKRSKCLADAYDFQYMRTVFPLDDEKEDGFVYLPDAFIRQLIGPASRIKEKRRVEALTSLYMLTNAALLCAWETGKLPTDLKTALAGAGLRADDVAIPPASSVGKKEGQGEVGLRWDAERQMAVSSAYNTIHFATPLIELPIDGVTRVEAQQYAHFREEYEKLWQTYFDPVGLRLSLDDNQVRVETHILPLVGSDEYRNLRQLVGPGGFPFQPRTESVVDFRLGGADDNGKGENSIAFQVDADSLLQQIVELLIRWEAAPQLNLRREYDRLFWKLPLGVSLREQRLFPDGVDTLLKLLNGFGLVLGEPETNTHRKVKLYRLTISKERYRELSALLNGVPQDMPFATILAVLPRQEAPPILHVAVIDGAICISANEAFLKKRIDESEARSKSGRPKPAAPAGDANVGLYISPTNAGPAASLFLEYEGHSLALLNNQVWNCFYQTGLLAANAADGSRTETARRFLNFVPVSPDGSAYRYDARLREVVNGRHGSFRRPELHDRVADNSELGKLLKQIKSVRAELRFLDNGLHTRVIIERKPAAAGLP